MYEKEIDQISLSVLDYYVSLLHDICVNLRYSFYHLSNFLRRFRNTIKFIFSQFILQQAYLASLAMFVDMFSGPDLAGEGGHSSPCPPTPPPSQPASNNFQPFVFYFFLLNCFIISPIEGLKIKKSRETD